jgi:predicted transposase YdaD
MYDRYWDSVRTQRTYILDALDEGEAIGLEKGRAEGRAEGEAIGIEKGRAEGEAIGLLKGLRDVVLKAHQGGMPLMNICTLTGLPEEEVNKLITLNS